MMNFLILLLAMCASGIIGFFLGRARYQGENAEQLHAMDAEIQRMKRRTHDANNQAARIKADRDRMKRHAAVQH